MELLVTLRNQKLLSKIVNCAQGVIAGSFFSLSYSYTLDELTNINNFCKKNRLKMYVCIDAFISEDDKPDLYRYMDFLKTLDVDGIYFHDLAVYEISNNYGLKEKLIYDGGPVLCNILETAYYLSTGIDGVVISRELTFDEANNILTMIPSMVDMQVFGYLRMSYSKRRFIKNYLKEINRTYTYEGSKTLSLVEEKRNYNMPIVEDEYGTRIYSDFIFETINEIPELKKNIRRAIIETLFIDDEELIVTICREYARVTKENREFLKQAIYAKFPNRYSSGYFYQKTNITKDE